MRSKFLREFIPPDNVPNRFTVGMGELIKEARIEAKMTQEDLAEKIFVRQSTLSKMERGKIEVDSSELVYLANALNKPIMYFFPKQLIRPIDRSEKKEDPLLDELFITIRPMGEDNIKQLISIARALVDHEEREYWKD